MAIDITEVHLEAERMLHDRFANQQVHGEWFNLTDEDIHDLCTVTEIVISDQEHGYVE